MNVRDTEAELVSPPLDDEESVAASDSENSEPARKRSRKTVASFVRRGQRVYPQSAYVGSPAYERASTVKSERDVLSRFLVPLDFWSTLIVGRRGSRV